MYPTSFPNDFEPNSSVFRGQPSNKLNVFCYKIGYENARFLTNHSKSRWRKYIDKQRSMLQYWYPWYISTVKKAFCIELLSLIEDRDKDQGKSHQWYSNKNKQRICTLCLQNFIRECTFDCHTEICQSEKGLQVSPIYFNFFNN